MIYYKKKLKLTVLLSLALCLLVGCNSATTKTDNSSSVSNTGQLHVDDKEKDTVDTSPSEEQISQDYLLDDFIYNEADVVLFEAQSEDYIKTEIYWQGKESYTTERFVGSELKAFTQDIIFHLTRILEFDDTGKLIAQREKYTFQTDWTVPKDVYFQDMIDRADYTNVKLVEQVIYADIAQDYLNTEKSKQDYIEDFTQKNSKFYMSVPVRTKQEQAIADEYMVMTPTEKTPYSMRIRVINDKQADIMVEGVHVDLNNPNASWVVFFDEKYAVRLRKFKEPQCDICKKQVGTDGSYMLSEIAQATYEISDNTLIFHVSISSSEKFDFNNISNYRLAIDQDGNGFNYVDFTLE